MRRAVMTMRVRRAVALPMAMPAMAPFGRGLSCSGELVAAGMARVGVRLGMSALRVMRTRMSGSLNPVAGAVLVAPPPAEPPTAPMRTSGTAYWVRLVAKISQMAFFWFCWPRSRLWTPYCVGASQMSRVGNVPPMMIIWALSMTSQLREWCGYAPVALPSVGYILTHWKDGIVRM
jgi:hypothetical protein